MSEEKLVFPITFGISENKIAKTRTQKVRYLSPLMPGDIRTYIYTTEESYYHQYAESYFGLTFKKHGWDTMRTLEIIANRCIPVFLNIQDCPKRTLWNYPKELLVECKQFFDNNFSRGIDGIINDESFNSKYNEYVDRLIDWLENNATNRKIGEYVLSKIPRKDITKILCINKTNEPDYQCISVVDGLKIAIGSGCTECPTMDYLYHVPNDRRDFSNLYGKGFSYCGIIDLSCYSDRELNTDVFVIESLITNKYFDIIIYGSPCNGLPYHNLARMAYSWDEIIYIDGDDYSISEERCYGGI